MPSDKIERSTTGSNVSRQNFYRSTYLKVASASSLDPDGYMSSKYINQQHMKQHQQASELLKRKLDPRQTSQSPPQQRTRDTVRTTNIRVGMAASQPTEVVPAPLLKPAPTKPNDENLAPSSSSKPLSTAKTDQIEFKAPESYVGFATLPNQLHRRAVRQGFCFNLMVVGESGLGKSTFLNSLFMAELNDPESRKEFINRQANIKITTKIKNKTVKLNENGVGLDLTIIDTPGFGDSLDNSGCWEPIVEHIDSGFANYLNAEFNIDRRLPIEDRRVHCCLYFIAPTGHCLRSIDIELLTRLSDRVNIVPLIAKSDTLTAKELKSFKQQIMTDLRKHKINIYDFGMNATTAPAEEFNDFDPKTMMPFAVVGSNCVRKDPETGQIVRGREYAWGFVNADNTDHCDFRPLRLTCTIFASVLIAFITNPIDLADYRKSHRFINQFQTEEEENSESTRSVLAEENIDDSSRRRNLLSQIEDEKREFDQWMNQMKLEMDMVYENKVAEKLAKLEETRQNVLKTRENYERSIQEDKEKLNARRAQLEMEKKEESIKQALNAAGPPATSTPKHKRSIF